MITVKKCATAKDMRAPGAPCGPYGNQFLERDLTVFEILFRLGILIAAVSFVWWALSNGFYSQVITGLLIAGVVLAVPNIFVFQPFGMTLSFVFLVVAVVIMIFSPSNKKVSFDYCKSIGAERRYVGRTSLCEMPDGTVRIPK